MLFITRRKDERTFFKVRGVTQAELVYLGFRKDLNCGCFILHSDDKEGFEKLTRYTVEVGSTFSFKVAGVATSVQIELLDHYKYRGEYTLKMGILASQEIAIARDNMKKEEPLL
jgi:Fe-S oxidoreductase